MLSDNAVDAAYQGEAELSNPPIPLVSNLFDGIFDEDDQACSQSDSELERDSELVTTEDDEDEGPDPDFWF